jgi:F-type H+-transporting ATPase subunit delta
MLNPRLASRYAKSLIDISIEHNCLEDILQDMQLVNTICQQNSDFVAMMRSPIIKADKKTSIIDAIFSSKVTKLSNSFFKLLINKGREQNIDEIATAFIAQYRHYKNMRFVKLTTASAVHTSVVETLQAKLSNLFAGSSIHIETAIDPSLLGGFVLDMGDKQMDASVARDLNDIKKQFSKNYYVAQM